MDPLLKLYHGCRIMLPCNTSVREGQANGTRASLEKVILKSGELPQQVLLGNIVPISAVSANQVSYILLRHSNERIQPSTFIL